LRRRLAAPDGETVIIFTVSEVPGPV